MARPNTPHGGLIIRQREPVNLEYPFDQLDSFLTPNELFYIRSHYKAPTIDRDRYELSVSGAVKHPFTVSYSELLEMPVTTRPVTLECAGNGRVFMVPQVKGAQWQLGAVSTAEWTGVPLTALLARAGLEPGAREIVFEAADRGTPAEEPVPPGQTPYARSIAVSKAADVLVAYQMNGAAIPLDHGFPVRAIVLGDYGMASVKWLTHIRVTTDEFRGYWQTSDYAYWDYVEGNPVRRPLGPMRLKSSIARPGTRELVLAGSTYPVYGAAWSGGSPVAKVEVSTDGGQSWGQATFLDDARPFVWRRWSFEWHVPETAGTSVLMSRATDAEGGIQAQHHDERNGTYVIDQILPIEVTVRRA